ncbi:MAG: VOC family protein [Pseudomonadota bacterium]
MPRKTPASKTQAAKASAAETPIKEAPVQKTPAKRAAKKTTVRKVAPVPKGFRTVTPYLTVRGAAAAMEFYKAAFGAEEKGRIYALDGQTILHAELKIGTSTVLVMDECPDYGILSPTSLGGSPTMMQLYVADVDALWEQALAAGAHEVLPLGFAYWGDRCGKLVDPFGHFWSIASKVENLSQEEIESRARLAGAVPPETATTELVEAETPAFVAEIAPEIGAQVPFVEETAAL